MPAERLSMRNTREILRQKWLLQRPHRPIAASVGVSVGAVGLVVKRAHDAELTWQDSKLSMMPSSSSACIARLRHRHSVPSPTASGFIVNGTGLV